MGEECAPQHKLVMCDMTVEAPRKCKRQFKPRIKLWKLKDPDTRAAFAGLFASKVEDAQPKNVEEIWTTLKGGLSEAAKETCGLSSRHRWHKQTWWWNDDVDKAVKEKRRCFKA